MRKILLLLLLIVFYPQDGEAQIQRILATASIPTNGSGGSGALVDDFDSAQMQNNLGGSIGIFEGAGGTAFMGFENLISENGNSLQLDFDVSPAGSFSGFFSQLQGLDASGFQSLSFRVRGETGSENFRFELKNATETEAISTASLVGSVGNTWQTISVPLSTMTNITDFTSLTEFTIVFDNNALAGNGDPVSGRVYIDNIRFDG